LDKAGGVVPEVQSCSDSEDARLTKEITSKVAAVRQGVPKFVRTDLDKSQREWKRFQTAHCGLIYDVWGGGDTPAAAGTDGKTYWGFCIVQTDVERLAELDRILKFVKP
jgi:hypothetical protein